MKKILLKGYYGFGNLGDDILLKVSHHLLRDLLPEASISIYSENTPNNRNYSDEKDFNKYIQNIISEEAELVDWTHSGNYDLLFNGGGGLYKDHNKGGRKYLVANAIARKVSPQVIRKTESFVRRGLKKKENLKFSTRIGFGLSIGPFTKSAPTFISSLSELGSYDSLLVRDEASFNFLKAAGYKNNYGRITDIAFLTSRWLPEKFNSIICGKVEDKSVGVVLLDWHKDNSLYFNNIKKVRSRLEQEGINVQLISFQKSYDKKYQEFFRGEVIAWDPNRMSLEGFLMLLQKQSILITARAHGAILGACLGVPSICLGITLKLEEVANMLKSSSKLIAPPFEPNEVLESVFHIFNNYNFVKEELNRDLIQNKKIAGEAEKQLRFLIKKTFCQ